MSSQVQEKSKFEVISTCFTKLASFKSCHNQWRTNVPWASLLWAHFQDVLSPILNKDEELNGKLFNAATKKDKFIKKKQNYKEGTNAVGIVSRDYKPTVTMNGKITCLSYASTVFWRATISSWPELLANLSANSNTRK
jgi:hypothetical protein